MDSHNLSAHSSLNSLNEEINDIYATYASKNGDPNHSHSLNSSSNEAGLLAAPPIFQSSNLHNDHGLARVSDHGSRLQITYEDGTPHSDSSFDFNLNGSGHGITNSSLNVLVDTPASTKDQLVPSEVASPASESLNPLDVQNDSALATGDSLPSYEPYSETMEPVQSAGDNDWVRKGSAERTISDHNGERVVTRNVQDFEFGKELGEGSYSTVVLATDKHTSAKYAVKILEKRHIIKEKKVKYVNIEKHALNRLSKTEGIISLFFTFQDQNSLYFVLDFASNGELLGLIKRYGTLNEDCTRYFSAQILDAMNHMHLNGVIHRDIKPENILLDDKFRIRITDFGTAKILEKKVNGETGTAEDYPLDVRAKSFVGTAEYVSPELLENKYCGKPGDIWAFGCIVYQMIAGKPPFKAPNEYLTFQKITKLQYAFSAGFPSVLRDLIKQILVLQPSRRATIEEIQKHFFFQLVDFKDSDLIWHCAMPELSPYKMTAKSMMKVPATPPSASTQKKVIKKPSKKSSPAVPSTDHAVDHTGARNFTPASVAAYVLGKDDESPHSESEAASPKPATPKSVNGNSRRSGPEYIPGTKILRPQIHTMSNFSKTSLSVSSKTDRELSRKLTSRVMEVTPLSDLEINWRDHLIYNERIIQFGMAMVRKQPTEVFEKKNKGLIHDAPLSYFNQLQMLSRTSSRSMLSHVVQGSRLRDSVEASASEAPHNERGVISFFYDENLFETDSVSEEDEEKSGVPNATKLGKSLFKKLLNSDKKQESSGKSGSSGSDSGERRVNASFEKARSYTIIVTSFGRVLLCLRDKDGHRSGNKVVCEIKLNYPFVHLKEVVSNSGTKFGKMLPTSGIFAIVAGSTTFIFETEKTEVTRWTEALAKSKLNQHEREKEAELKSSQVETPKSSPRLNDSPVQSTPPSAQAHASSTSVTASPRIQKPQQRDSTTSPKEGREHQMFQRKTKNRETTKRKPPPSLPTSPILGSSGLLREQSQGETVHAAQLAVSKLPPTTRVEDRRSSFSRESGQGSSYRPATNGGGGAKITSMNSKFLARSRGKK